MHETAGALLGIDPVAALHNTELQKTDIDHVSDNIVHFNTVSDIEGFAGHDKGQDCQIGDGIVHGNGDTGAGKPQNGGQLTNFFEPD